MRQKHLESALSSVQREFPNPDVSLEQYPTSPQLTAAVILAALERDDVGPGRSTCDLGCGTAMLSLGWYVVLYVLKHAFVLLQRLKKENHAPSPLFS